MDKVSKEIRRKTMQAVKSKNTRLENIVTKELWKQGLRFRKNVKELPGKPDIAIKKYKIVIFIDSCFWHGCPYHGRRPKSNQDFWNKKISRNSQRDIEITEYYKKIDWNVLRVWEHEIKEDLNKTLQKIICFIEKVKEKK